MALTLFSKVLTELVYCFVVCSRLTEWNMIYQYKTGAFKVSTMRGWMVYLNPSHLEEVVQLPTDVMSFRLALNDVR